MRSRIPIHFGVIDLDYFQPISFIVNGGSTEKYQSYTINKNHIQMVIVLEVIKLTLLLITIKKTLIM